MRWILGKIKRFLRSKYGEMLLGAFAGAFSAFAVVQNFPLLSVKIVVILLGSIGGIGLGYIVWQLDNKVRKHLELLKKKLSSHSDR